MLKNVQLKKKNEKNMKTGNFFCWEIERTFISFYVQWNITNGMGKKQSIAHDFYSRIQVLFNELNEKTIRGIVKLYFVTMAENYFCLLMVKKR